MKKAIILNSIIILGAGIFAFQTINSAQTTKTATDKQVQTYKKKAESKKKEVKELQEYVDKLQVDNEDVTTGLSSALQKEDKALIKKVFTPVFTWTSGSEYDSMRDTLISQFGAENSFITTYIPENIKVAVPDGYKGANNDIDINGTKSKLKNIEIYPTTWNKDTGEIKYMVVIEYQLYINDNELTAKNMETNLAYLEFTISGDEGSRTLTNLNGFDVTEVD